MAAPGVTWEAGLHEDIAEGGKLRFVSAGKEGDDTNEIVGWYVVVDYPDGRTKLLIKRFKIEPRLIKTFPGVVALARTFCPDMTKLEFSLYPEVRSTNDAWKLARNIDQ